MSDNQKLIVTEQMLRSKMDQLNFQLKEVEQTRFEFNELLDAFDSNAEFLVEGMEQAPHSLCKMSCKTCKETLKVSE